MGIPNEVIEITIRIILSAILGGIIGIERESVNRPAGFRTHILVALGSTIVMLTNIYLVSIVHTVNVAPGRFGAAVISGIGFLGAGTIIKEGSAVKGLTTAASLWATACIGITLGAGMYFIALISTFIVFITLELFPKFEDKMFKYKISILHIEIKDKTYLEDISQILNQHNITTLSLNMKQEEEKIIIDYKIKCSKKLDFTKISKDFLIKGVININVENKR